jgi:hypothetical protein
VAARLIGKGLLLMALVVVMEGLILIGPGSRATLGDSYLSAWSLKHQHLVAPGRHRLLLTGGSNIAFGVDSALMREVTSRDTINLGLHGGLGLALMLHEIEDGARPGDLVILIPEYEHFFGDMMNGQLPAAEVLRYDWSALPYFSSWRQWRSLLTNSQTMASAAALALFDRAKTTVLRRPPIDHDTHTLYRRTAFDVHGDIVGNTDRESLPDRVAASSERITGPYNQAAVEAIARCGELLSSRGIEFIVVYPSVSASYWSVNKDLAMQVAERMPARWTRTRPEDWVFDDRLFYDSSYHLNQSGRERRTRQLVLVLQPERAARRP